MRDKKKILKFLFIIVPTSLLLSIIFYIIYAFTKENYGVFQYLWSLMISVFAGAIILLVTSVIEYHKNRRDILEKVYLGFHKLFVEINKLQPIDNQSFDKKTIDQYYEFSKISFAELDWYYGQLDLFKCENELKKICSKWYSKKEEILKSIRLFNFHYSNNAPNQVLLEHLKKIEKILFNNKTIDHIEYYTSKIISDFDHDLHIFLDKVYKKKTTHVKDESLDNKGYKITKKV